MRRERLTKEELDKLRSISQRRVGGPGTVQKVYKDERGSHETHHWDGRQDAMVCPASIEIEVRPKEGK